ncbi:hypothetical protein HK097_004956, partial [Rhizophlyctis rosea]
SNTPTPFGDSPRGEQELGVLEAGKGVGKAVGAGGALGAGVPLGGSNPWSEEGFTKSSILEPGVASEPALESSDVVVTVSPAGDGDAGGDEDDEDGGGGGLVESKQVVDQGEAEKDGEGKEAAKVEEKKEATPAPPHPLWDPLVG